MNPQPPEVKFVNAAKVSAHRFVQVGVTWKEDAGPGTRMPYFYFAIGVNPDGNLGKDGFRWLELARIHLKTRAIDWTMKVDFPRRAWKALFDRREKQISVGLPCGRARAPLRRIRPRSPQLCGE